MEADEWKDLSRTPNTTLTAAVKPSAEFAATESSRMQKE